jgi:hypothetical protein
MTQEQKDLLLKDLCGRLPYGVKVEITRTNWYSDKEEVVIKNIKSVLPSMYAISTTNMTYSIQDVKPYLFPLSSMTEEQKKEISKRYNYYNLYQLHVEITNHSEGYWDNDNSCNLQDYLWLEDWFNKNHFDYRGLIPMGLANNATGKNIY